MKLSSVVLLISTAAGVLSLTACGGGGGGGGGFYIDKKAPALTEITPVPALGNDPTPSYTFSSTEKGTFFLEGDCTTSQSTIVKGENTVTLNALADGYYDNCKVTASDKQGNSITLNITPFTIDTTAPTLTITTAVSSYTNDNTPSFTFNSSEAGSITYGGDCASSTTSAVAGNNTITFNASSPLDDGLHNDCTIVVKDALNQASNTLTVPAFTVDTVVPTLELVTAVPSLTNDSTPDYSFSSSESGAIHYSGDCASLQTTASAGSNTITFLSLDDGEHTNCSLTVEDVAGNVSGTLLIAGFTVDTTAPELEVVTAISTPANDSSPDFTFYSSEAGVIDYSGSCESSTVEASSGNNTITLSELDDGTYTDCVITVEDAAGNVSSNLSIASFTIDTVAPGLAVVTAVPSIDNNSTPGFTFSSSEAGSIAYSGDCSSSTGSASSGNNTITLSALVDDTYTNCELTVEDAAGNTSDALSLGTFTVDTVAPELAVVTAVPTTGNDTSPDFTFSSTEDGDITYGGSCSSEATEALEGDNTITLDQLAGGTYNDCTVTVTDAAGNASEALEIEEFTIVILTRALNDTGFTLCGNYYPTGNPSSMANTFGCSGVGATQTVAGSDGTYVVPAGQDAVYGRDANVATNSNADGHAGFSFTKIASNGSALDIQNGIYNETGDELSGTHWSCVQDNVTGLVWEVKTDDGGLHDKDWTSTWYNNNSSSNGGDAGTADAGSCLAANGCDTEQYVAAVNAAGLCGATDWRLPTAEELLSITTNDRLSPAIDSDYFPNVISNGYWSADSVSALANITQAWQVSFVNGSQSTAAKSAARSVRLVREASLP